MFIRIKRRRLKSSDDQQPDYSLRVYVVENRRIKGSPRQKVIAYLGSIRASDMNIVSKRNEFIHNASQHLTPVTSDYHEIIRLKRTMVKLLVMERYSNSALTNWTEPGSDVALNEKMHQKMVEAKEAAIAAQTEMDNTIRSFRIYRAETPSHKRER
jgi:hypothetical protein